MSKEVSLLAGRVVHYHCPKCGSEDFVLVPYNDFRRVGEGNFHAYAYYHSGYRLCLDCGCEFYLYQSVAL